MLRGALLAFAGSLVGIVGTLLYTGTSSSVGTLSPERASEYTRGSAIATAQCKDQNKNPEEEIFFVSCGGLY